MVWYDTGYFVYEYKTHYPPHCDVTNNGYSSLRFTLIYMVYEHSTLCLDTCYYVTNGVTG